jgi:hypothetical protein
MKKMELVYNYVLEQVLEKKRTNMTQSGLSTALGISLSTINAAISHLERMGAVRVGLRSFGVVNAKKILYFWASTRNVSRDVVYATRADLPVAEIEKRMPPGVIYASYTAYKLRFGDVPSDYSEVYVYGDAEKIKKRFPPSKNKPNIFVIKEGPQKMTIANIFVDIWNMKEWYAKEFLAALERRIDGILA